MPVTVLYPEERQIPDDDLERQIFGPEVRIAHTQELRALLRTRKQFVRERSRHIQRLQKTLEDANIKLDSALSDVLGLSGRAMIEALIAGESDPDTLAGLAHRRVKAPPEELREALRRPGDQAPPLPAATAPPAGRCHRRGHF